MSEIETQTGRAILDPQDPLPESNWKPRRHFVAWSMIGAFLLLSLGMWHGAATGLLVSIVCYCALVAILYLVAPSAEQLANIAQHVAAMKSGITFKSSSSADLATGRVETSSSATPALSPDAKPGD